MWIVLNYFPETRVLRISGMPCAITPAVDGNALGNAPSHSNWSAQLHVGTSRTDERTKESEGKRTLEGRAPRR